MGVHVLRTIASWAVVIGKIIALGVLLTAAPGGWGLNSLGRAAVFAEAGRYFILTFYTLVLLFSFLAIIIAPFLTCVYLRIPILVFAMVAFGADQLYGVIFRLVVVTAFFQAGLLIFFFVIVEL